MTRYGLFTFNPHSNDCYLNKELINTLHPLVEKTQQYVLTMEKCGTPEEHIHFLFAFNGDTEQKVKQRIENKAITLFKTNALVNTMTQYEKAFNYRIVKNTTEDKMYTIGYCYKDGYAIKSLGFSQEYITKCIQHYHTSERNKAKNMPETSWQVLSLRNAHVQIETFAKNNNMSVVDKYLYLRMKEQRISFCQISKKQQDIIHDELVVANIKKEVQKTRPKSNSEQFALNVAVKNIIEGEPNDYYKDLYHKLISDLTSQKDMNEMRFKIETACLAEGV